MGIREDFPQTRGATQDSINSLPTYKFKVKKNKGSGNDKENGLGGIVAAGTEHERVISGEDAVSFFSLHLEIIKSLVENGLNTRVSLFSFL